MINCTSSARPGPVLGARLEAAGGGAGTLTLAQHQAGFSPLPVGIRIALVPGFFLKETGPAGQKT